jgi:hypothetical protein
MEIDKAEVEIDQIINNSLVEQSESLELEMNMDNCNMDTATNTFQQSTTDVGGDTSTENQEDPASIEIFNTALHQYLRIDEEIKSLMVAVKERNDIKRKLGDTLSSYLKAKQIKKVNLDGSYKGKRLEVEVKTSTSGFSKTAVTEALLSELQEETELFDKVMRAISKTRVLKEVWNLKVIEEKKAKATTGGTKKKGKGRQIGTSMADAAALFEDDS